MRGPFVLAPKVQIRMGREEDLQTILEIRSQLPMPRGAQARHGGFLLGSDPQVYRAYLQGSYVWMLEISGEVEAFCIAVPNEVLRASQMWSRRDEIVWTQEAWRARIEQEPVAYIDQLAARTGALARYWSTALALFVVDRLGTGAGAACAHSLIATTTVLEPVANRAAWSFLERAQALQVGQLEEYYPQAGRILSAVFLLDYKRARDELGPLRRRFFPNLRSGSARCISGNRAGSVLRAGHSLARG